jgi:chitin synthase
MELVLVRDLCGTFCFSMQFVVFMELFGTSVLPAAIVFTVYLAVVFIIVVKQSMSQSGDQMKYILEHGPIGPLIMLFAVLGLPGILVMLTTQKIIYVLWMFVYLLGLPVWNFVLPVYAFWHFDDFSWGETRKVEGDNGDDHSKKEGVFDASSVPLKRWHEYEKENRLRQGSSPYIGSQGSPYNSPKRSPMGPRPGARPPQAPRPGGSPMGPRPGAPPPQGQRPQYMPTPPSQAVRPNGRR